MKISEKIEKMRREAYDNVNFIVSGGRITGTYTEEDFDRDLAKVCSETDLLCEENQVVKICSHDRSILNEKQKKR
jgi:hypothetical protein